MNERPDEVIKTAVLLCQYMTNRYESKKHGGYKYYEDDKISIALDTYVPNLDIYVFTPNGKRNRVLAKTNNGDIMKYNPGKWEGYILSFGDVALASKEAYDKAREKREREKYAQRFSKVSKDIDDVFT